MPKVGVGKTTMGILSGQLDLATWSEEELLRAQRKSKRGTWEGRPPKLVPKAIHDELVRRKMSKAYELMRNNVVKATEVLIDIAQDPEVDAAVRLKAIAMIHDRVLGRAPEKVELKLGIEPWMQAIEAGVVSIPRSDIIDVEAREDDDE